MLSNIKFYSRDIFSLNKKDESEIKELKLFSPKYCYYVGFNRKKDSDYVENIYDAILERLTRIPNNHTYECYIGLRQSGFSVHMGYWYEYTAKDAIVDIINQNIGNFSKLETKDKNGVIKFFFEILG